MKKSFTILAIALCSTLAMAQTNQYFWAGGQFIMGNPIGQIDSVTFGELAQTDSVLLYLPRTVKVIYDTVIKYVTVHDTINPCAVPDGAISGKFSVSPTKQVYFAKGNLQFSTKDSTWRFAENQYEYIGKDNVLNAHLEERNNPESWASKYYWQGTGTGLMIDLFAWSSDTDSDKQWGVESATDDDSKFYGSLVDWGINMGDSWYTMDGEEWTYLLSERPNADKLISVGTVKGINGCIILPDDWKTPKQISFNPGTASQNDSTSFATINNYTLEEWKIMEIAGAVFLPASGDRNLTQHCLNWVNITGAYWCSSIANQDCGNTFNFCANRIFVSNGYFHGGRSVRLVQEVK